MICVLDGNVELPSRVPQRSEGWLRAGVASLTVATRSEEETVSDKHRFRRRHLSPIERVSAPQLDFHLRPSESCTWAVGALAWLVGAAEPSGSS